MARLTSLRWRLGILYALVIGVALAVVLLLVSGLVERALIASTAERLEIEAGLIAARGGATGSAATSLPAADVARILGGQETAVLILDESGSVLATQDNGAPQAVVDARLDASTYRAILEGNGTVDAVMTEAETGERVLVVAASIRFTSGATAEGEATPAPTFEPGPPSEPPGRGRGLGRGLGGNPPGQGQGAAVGPPNAIAQLSVSLAATDAALGELRATLLLVGLGAFAVALAISLVVTALGLRPLSRVAAVADRVAAGDLAARTRLPGGSDEIGRLGRAFDRMVARLEAAFGAQRQFAADASHELRSPLTVLGGYVDVLAQGALAAPEAAERILGAMRREIDRLSRLASDLLFLTQLEAGAGQMSPESIDVADLLADLGEAARVMADGRLVEVEVAGPLHAIADRDRLTQALLNLVDNAVRHTSEGGLVRLSGARDAADVAVEVFNEGAPIPAGQLPRLFDRFYRGDRSVEPGRHAGLGLAIVKAIIVASGGSVEARSDASGTRFVVRLPAADQQSSQRLLSERSAEPQLPLLR